MNSKILYELAKIRIISPILRFALIPIRFKIAFYYFKSSLMNLLKWLLFSKELTNFTYDLTDINKKYLSATLSLITNTSEEKILGYIEEIHTNAKLKQYLEKKIIKSNYNFMADVNINFSRRVGWYALVRAMKPKIVVESGVDKGLGSVVIAEALRKNKSEGYTGGYYGTDNVLAAGYLFDKPYNDYGQILYGDSITSLKNLKEKVDVFINDSEHSSSYEAREYEAIKSKLSKKAIIVGDNSHATDKLFAFSVKNNRNFLFWSEKPKNHWYPGAGMGISFPKKVYGKKG